LLVDADNAVWLAPKTVHSPVDSTAAGDAFNGGLMAGVARGKTVCEAIPNAHDCAARVVLHSGALAPAEAVHPDKK
jgi:2-dehydro-3-deoxygluconokinase